MKTIVPLPHPDSREFADIDTQLTIAQALEAAGVDACSVSDHPFPVVDETRTGHPTFDPFVLLGCIAGVTSRLALHTHVIVLPYRSPFVVANAANTLDHASGGGRLVVGVGAGYLESEFAAVGADFKARNEMVEEGIAALKHAWSGKPVTMHTERWTAAGNTLYPSPLSLPHPPIWIGGNSRAAMDRAVRLCQGWAPVGNSGQFARHIHTASIGSFDELRRRIGLLRELCERYERTDPIDICLVKPPTDWTRGLTESRVVAELEELADMGVTWIHFRFTGSTSEEILEKISAWREIAPAASNIVTRAQLPAR